MPQGVNNALSSRLAALTEIRQVQVVGVADEVVAAVKKTVERNWLGLLRVLVATERPYGDRRRKTLHDCMMSIAILEARILTTLMGKFRQAVKWGYDSQFQCFVEALPEPYWFGVMRRPVQESVSFPGVPNSSPAAVIYNPPSPAAVNAWIDRLARPGHGGMNWIESLERRYATEQDALRNIITDGMARGQNPRIIAKAIQPVIRHTAWRAQTIARTETLRIANAMQMENYRQFASVIVGFRRTETLDDRTRPHHRVIHGTIYWVEGEPNVSRMPALPDEPNCRGTYTPVMRTLAEVLARSGQVIPDLPRFGPGTVASKYGPIPDPGTFARWFDTRASLADRQKLVGFTRWNAMWNKLRGVRSPTFADFHDQEGRLIPLREIEEQSVLQIEIRREAMDRWTQSYSAQVALELSAFPLRPPPVPPEDRP